MTIVNGFKYDVWTVGILAVELFTNQSILNCPQWEDKDPTWTEVMYPRLYNILEKRNFKKLMKSAYIYSKISKKKVKYVRNFVHGCLSINPKCRPDVKELSSHVLFGGSESFEHKPEDVWKNKVSIKKINSLVLRFVLQAWSLELPGDVSEFQMFESSKENESVEKRQNESL